MQLPSGALPLPPAHCLVAGAGPAPGAPDEQRLSAGSAKRGSSWHPPGRPLTRVRVRATSRGRGGSGTDGGRGSVRPRVAACGSRKHRRSEEAPSGAHGCPPIAALTFPRSPTPPPIRPRQRRDRYVSSAACPPFGDSTCLWLSLPALRWTSCLRPRLTGPRCFCPAWSTACLLRPPCLLACSPACRACRGVHVCVDALPPCLCLPGLHSPRCRHKARTSTLRRFAIDRSSVNHALFFFFFL